MQDTLYVAEGVDAHGETTRAIEISLLGVTPGEPSTFLPEKKADLASAWQKWIDQWFVPVLAPAFVEIHQFAGKFHLEEAAAANFDLDQKLPDLLRARSLKAGALFLEGKTEMKHHPEWLRFSQKIEQGETPGHALTLAALQTVLYHLGLIPALTSFAWFEFHSGLTRSDSGTDILCLVRVSFWSYGYRNRGCGGGNGNFHENCPSPSTCRSHENRRG